MPELGEPFEIAWRVISHINQAQISYYYQRVEVFMHAHSDEDVVRLYATQDWLDAHRDDPGAASAEYMRSYMEGTVVDPDAPFEHEQVDRPEA